LSLVSYHTQDPSWNTAAGRASNLAGYPGAGSPTCFCKPSAPPLSVPLLAFLLSWKWIRSDELDAGAVKIFGSALLTLGVCAMLSFVPLRISAHDSHRGTLAALANYLVESLNLAGALLATATRWWSRSTWFPRSRWPGWGMVKGPIGWLERRARPGARGASACMRVPSRRRASASGGGPISRDPDAPHGSRRPKSRRPRVGGRAGRDPHLPHRRRRPSPCRIPDPWPCLPTPAFISLSPPLSSYIRPAAPVFICPRPICSTSTRAHSYDEQE